MKNNALNSATDGNGVYRIANPVANHNLSGPDVLGLDNNQGMLPTNTNTVPSIRVTQATQQAFDYYNKIATNCQNCK